MVTLFRATTAVLLLAAPPAVAGIEPDGDFFQLICDAPPGVAVTLPVLPDGSGRPLTAARGPQGQVLNATIHLFYFDAYGNPLVGMAPEDMWLGSVDGGLAVCAQGSIADRATDTHGETVWVQPLRAGGWSTAGCQVYHNGWELAGPSGLNLRFCSPDLDGNLRVDLSDVATFAGDFYGAHAFRSDLDADGTVNLGDIAVMAQSLGRDCP